jgi:hypothetical protein
MRRGATVHGDAGRSRQPELQGDTRARSASLRSGRFALTVAILASIVMMNHQAHARADTVSKQIGATDKYPSFSGGTLSGDELSKALREKHGAHLSNVSVTGIVRIPSDLEVLDGEAVTISDRLDASSSKGGSVKFEDSTFMGTVAFNESSFDELTFKKSTFRGIADFSYSGFRALQLDSSIFERQLNFSYSTIGAEEGDDKKFGCDCLSLFSVTILGYTDFTSTEILTAINTTQLFASAPINIDWSLLEDKGFADFDSWVDAYNSFFISKELARRAYIYEAQLRFWKKNFEDTQKPRDALAVNRRLIHTHRRYLLRPWNFEWWVTWILDVFTGYGTHPYRLLWIAVVIVLFFGVLYLRRDSFEPSIRAQPHSPWKALAISTVLSANTFLPLVKLVDEKRWNWRISPRYRWLELSEKALGVTIIALAAYSIKSFIL